MWSPAVSSNDSAQRRYSQAPRRDTTQASVSTLEHRKANQNPASGLWKGEGDDDTAGVATGVGLATGSPLSSSIQRAGRHMHAADGGMNDNRGFPNDGYGDGMLQKTLHRVTRRYEKLMQARDEVLDARTQEQREWQTCADLRRHYLESQENFMKQAEALLATQNSSDEMVYLRQLHRQTRADMNAMEVQAKITRNLEEKTSSMQYSLEDREKVFVEGCHNLAGILNLRGSSKKLKAPELANPSQRTASLESRASVVEMLDPRLDAYYDKAGDVGLIGEELANLDIEHEEAIAARMFLAERDEGMDLTDSQFQRDYRHARNEIEQRLETAIKQAQEQKQLCLDAGLDLNPRAKPRSQGTDDVLLDRSSELYDPGGRSPRRSRKGASLDWPILGPDSLFRQGPVFRDPDEPFDENFDLNGTGSPQGVDLSRHADVLQWASQIPEDQDDIAPETDIPEFQLEPEWPEEAPQASTWIPPPSAVHNIAPANVRDQSWRHSLRTQIEIAAMHDFSTELSSRYIRLKRQKQAKEVSRCGSNDWLDLAGWVAVDAPRRRSTVTHLQRRGSFDVTVNREAVPSRRYRLATLRSWISTSELHIDTSNGLEPWKL